jgi:hypothetical protein
MSSAQITNVITKNVNFHITNFNNFIIQLDIRLNSVNFILILFKNVIIKAFVHLLIQKLK